MLNQEAEQEMLRAFVAKTSYHQLPMFIVFANNEAIKNHTASKALKFAVRQNQMPLIDNTADKQMVAFSSKTKGVQALQITSLYPENFENQYIKTPTGYTPLDETLKEQLGLCTPGYNTAFHKHNRSLVASNFIQKYNSHYRK